MNLLKKDKGPIVFKAQAGEGALCLEMYDVIGSDFFGEGITASMVTEALSMNPDCSSVMVNINSPGGDLFEGVAIYNCLKNCNKPVNVNVMGVAASAASLIAMAGDTITMHMGTEMMIHRAMSMAAGYSDDMRKMADTLDQVSASAADIYVARTGMAKDKVLDMMQKETWMNAEQAVADGFATAVGKREGVKNSFDLSIFKNTPKELLKAEPEPEAQPAAPEIAPEPAATDVTDFRIDLLRKQYELNKRK